MSNEHIVKAFDRELDKLALLIGRMGEHVKLNFAHVRLALLQQDSSNLHEIIAGDEDVDKIEYDVDALTLRLLALREPKASDLRFIVAAQKIGTDLERVGDYCANIARHMQDLASIDLEPFLPILAEMFDTGQEMIDLAMAAYAEQNVEKAVRAWHLDDRMDDNYTRLMGQMMEHCGDTSIETNKAYASLLFTARGLERIGDHLANVAEHIYFQVIGEHIPKHL